ncbi:MAG: hypothetical protein AUH85_06160 [Chloroflexi bacterium 13_1_40CM_4_68_4]|nr:MAG: hypothetical protein AUH85_06160 [Chloroflexi bacterium 13_1_40CM_4_68_4]
MIAFCLDLWRSACRPDIFRRCATIAAVVGTLLTIVNQGDVVLAGRLEPALWWKIPANYVIPFVVSNLGAMSSLPPRG